MHLADYDTKQRYTTTVKESIRLTPEETEDVRELILGSISLLAEVSQLAFRVGQILNPYLHHYSEAFAFSRILYRHLRSPPLRADDSASWGIAPDGERFRLTTFRMIHR